ncbi:MAG: aminotransferase class V-fold PLP-dependent enzyme [Spirochaetales bacterium]|nr:aminotransferase class V-fold PLP-dependent enzyme [Spirochaetales bacterium]
MDWENIYPDFPVNKSMTWLNNCGTTPAMAPVVEEMKAYYEAYGNSGLFLPSKWSFGAVKLAIQKIIARLLNVMPSDVAVIHNTSEGMNFVSHGLKLKRGDELLLLENEYPSNVYPWEHWGKKGIVLKTVPSGASPDEFLSALERELNRHTRVICLSAVHWCTGMPLPVKEVAGICGERGILFMLDGAQGAGHVEIDMNWGIHACAFSAWKWLLGPLGAGLLVIPERHLHNFGFVFKGTGSVVDDGRYLPYRDGIKPSAERYMISTANFADWVYLRTSLEYLERIGFPKVMERIYALSNLLASGLKDLGFSLAGDAFPEIRTGIVCGKSDKMESGVIVNELAQNKIIVRERLGWVRFAPHIYISEDRVSKTLSVIEKILAGS